MLAVIILVFFQDFIVQIEDEVELVDLDFEVTEIVCRKWYMLITKRCPKLHIVTLKLLLTQLSYTLIQLVEGVSLLP